MLSWTDEDLFSSSIVVLFFYWYIDIDLSSKIVLAVKMRALPLSYIPFTSAASIGTQWEIKASCKLTYLPPLGIDMSECMFTPSLTQNEILFLFKENRGMKCVPTAT